MKSGAASCAIFRPSIATAAAPAWWWASRSSRCQARRAGEPYAVESISNGKRIRIGNADVFLSTRSACLRDHLPHHAATRLLRGFRRALLERHRQWLDLPHREGRRPSCTCRRARRSSSMPPIPDRRASRPRFPRGRRRQGSEYRAETTARLAPDEGFTVAVAWQKGIVTPPSEVERTLVVRCRQCRHHSRLSSAY